MWNAILKRKSVMEQAHIPWMLQHCLTNAVHNESQCNALFLGNLIENHD